MSRDGLGEELPLRVLFDDEPRTRSDDELSKDVVLNRLPGYLVRRLDSRLAALYETHTGQSALTTRQFGLLKVLYDHGSLRPGDLARRLDLDRSTLGEMLTRMLDRGLVRRHAVPDDRRTSQIELTEHGRDELLANLRGALDAQRAFLRPLPAYLRPVFMRCLEILADPEPDRATNRGGSS
jgi:DNA-binding MarR family transcriptional regulator